MSIATLPTPSISTAGSASRGEIESPARRKAVIVMDRIAIPEWVDDLESYRRWAHSDDYPASGWVSFLDGDIWVDPSMEEFITHNRVELEGTPDGVMEIISKTSQRKDKVVLRELYWRAGVSEYWLIDARLDPPEFDILRHHATGYESSPAGEGWQTSLVLGKQFRLMRTTDPLGHPQFAVEMR